MANRAVIFEAIIRIKFWFLKVVSQKQIIIMSYYYYI